MLITSNQMEKEIKKNMRGGEGEIEILHLVKKEDLTNARLLSKIIIPPGAGIGEHDHVDETEYYIILEGQGIANDDGKDINVKSGDVLVTGNGAKHSIKNSGKSDLVMIAVIILH
jgi:mannose-6-phosphate isomerase-like protein (cupin superfamily)